MAQPLEQVPLSGTHLSSAGVFTVESFKYCQISQGQSSVTDQYCIGPINVIALSLPSDTQHALLQII